MAEEVGRRRLLSAVGVGVACGLAGCAGAEAGGGRSVTVAGEGACVDGFRIVEEAARVASGRSASVRLRFVNESDAPLSYDARVVFERTTWIGNAVRRGQVSLAGALAAGESVVRTAALDEPGPGSTGYEVEASVTCEAT
ncbi:MAG: hypothetical protein V5A31_12620 [Haloferacaceae archaeon]|jgi:hypothetical protein